MSGNCGQGAVGGAVTGGRREAGCEARAPAQTSIVSEEPERASAAS